MHSVLSRVTVCFLLLIEPPLSVFCCAAPCPRSLPSSCSNKVDLVESDPNVRAVTEEQAREMALELDVPCVETSAQNGLHVEQAFVHVIEKIYANSQLSKQQGGAKAGAGQQQQQQQQRRNSKVELSGANKGGKTEDSKCCK
jgi:GTPase SAR1 family protein